VRSSRLSDSPVISGLRQSKAAALGRWLKAYCVATAAAIVTAAWNGVAPRSNQLTCSTSRLASVAIWKYRASVARRAARVGSGKLIAVQLTDRARSRVEVGPTPLLRKWRLKGGEAEFDGEMTLVLCHRLRHQTRQRTERPKGFFTAELIAEARAWVRT
jgi:hypothetical protein